MERQRPQLDPQHLEVLGREQCRELLASEPVGRLGFCLDDEPIVLPVNHIVDGWDVVFRVTEGSKMQAATRELRVAYEADGTDPETRTGWSVLVRGHAEHVHDPDAIRRLQKLGLEVWADAINRPIWVRIPIDEISGRRIPSDTSHRGSPRRAPDWS